MVLVDQAVEDGLPSDSVGLQVGVADRGGRCGALRWQLLPGLVGPVLVVVVEVFTSTAWAWAWW
jgi:hypothetical protein